MKNISWKTIITVVGAIGVCLCVGFVTIAPKAFVDFPCSAGYDTENQCVVIQNPMPDEDNTERIEVFFSTTQVGLGGGGCHIQESQTDLLDVDTPVLKLRFERFEEKLLVNGRELAAGEEFSFTRFWNPNPWTIYTIRFTNYGLVPPCESETKPRVTVIGEYESRVSVIKASVVLLVLLGLVFRLSRHSAPRAQNRTP